MRCLSRVVLAISCVLIAAAHAQQPAAGTPPPPRQRALEKQAAIAAASGKSATSPVSTSVVGMDQPVITLNGGCQPIDNLAPSKDCVGAVTRAQFEKLIDALQPDMPAEARRGFATNYGELLVFSDAGRTLRLENDPNFQLLLQFLTERLLADGVKRHYAEQFAHPSDQQIQTYYDKNSAKYLESDLQRIFIPRNPGAADKPKPTDAEETAVAEKFRQRWVAGDDPVKLQQAAFEAAGVSGAGTPDVTLGARRPGTLPGDQEQVFQLKAGEVSPVYSDAAAFYIYKVTSSRQIPLSEVKDAISKTLQQQQLQDKLEAIGKSSKPVLNDEYFGPAPAPGAPAMAGRPTPGGPAPSGNPPK